MNKFKWKYSKVLFVGYVFTAGGDYFITSKGELYKFVNGYLSIKESIVELVEKINIDMPENISDTYIMYNNEKMWSLGKIHLHLDVNNNIIWEY